MNPALTFDETTFSQILMIGFWVGLGLCVSIAFSFQNGVIGTLAQAILRLSAVAPAMVAAFCVVLALQTRQPQLEYPMSKAELWWTAGIAAVVAWPLLHFGSRNKRRRDKQQKSR